MNDELSVAFGYFELEFGASASSLGATGGAGGAGGAGVAGGAGARADAIASEGDSKSGFRRGAPGARKLAFVHNDVPYTREFLLKAFKGHSGAWELAETRESHPDDLVLQIDEYEEIHWERVLSGRLVASSYCVRKGLTRKANFAKHISKTIAKRPESILRTAVPHTIALNTWTDGGAGSLAGFIDRKSALAASLWEAREEMEATPGKLWVLKPSIANKGAEVTVVDDFSLVEETVKAWPDVTEWVLQAYVERPLLIARRKFHLRVYVLAVANLKVYVFREALVLIAMHSYDASDITDSYSHLTNTCVSVAHEDFNEKQYVRLLSDLPRLLRKQGTPGPEEKAAHIYDQIRTIMAESFHSFQGEFGSFMPLPNAFELFGVDFLVDETFGVSLLEFNVGPDLKMTGDRLDYVIEDMLAGMVDIVLDGGHFEFASKRSIRESGGNTSARETPRASPEGEADSVVLPPSDGSDHPRRGSLSPCGAGPGLHSSARHDRRAVYNRWDLVYDQKWQGAGGPSISFA